MSKETKELLVAVIGGIALIVSALITGFFSSAPTRMSIQATQTAEANKAPIIQLSATPTISITPTPQIIQNLQQTPVSTLPTQSFPLSTIPFRENELLLAITGAVLIFGFVGVLIYIPENVAYKGTPTLARLMASVAIIAPFALVWTSFFFSFPQNIPLALVLFIALLDLAIVLWFADFLFNKFNPLFVILLAICPIYIAAFGFTNMSISEAFIVASVITGVEILYVAGIVVLAITYKPNEK